jgi:hypothetical protein
MTTILTGAQVSPSGDSGMLGPSAVSADAGNQATLGSDGLVYINPSPAIWYQALRSYNSLGNPTMEVGQRNVGSIVTPGASGLFGPDRWLVGNKGTMQITGQNVTTSGVVTMPDGFAISNGLLRVTLTTAQASLGANDFINIWQNIEGPRLRELISGGHSVGLLVRSSVANLKFGFNLQDVNGAYSLTKLCQLGTALNWVWIAFPNLPQWHASGSFPLTPGNLGYFFQIVLAAGSAATVPANDVWVATVANGAIGQDNFASKPVNSYFDIAYAVHCPGNQVVPLDCAFAANLDDCLRYYEKSYQYVKKAGTANCNSGSMNFYAMAYSHPYNTVWFKKVKAKTPAVRYYSAQTGAINNMYDGSASVDRAGGGAVYVSEVSFGGLLVNTAPSTAWVVMYNWEADTGW